MTSRHETEKVDGASKRVILSGKPPGTFAAHRSLRNSYGRVPLLCIHTALWGGPRCSERDSCVHCSGSMPAAQ